MVLDRPQLRFDPHKAPRRRVDVAAPGRGLELALSFLQLPCPISPSFMAAM
jgi:hypothetical protein